MLLLMDAPSLLSHVWPYDRAPVDDVSVDELRSAGTVLLAPQRSHEPFRRILDLARDGKLPRVRILSATYKGRWLSDPTADQVVEWYVVHFRGDLGEKGRFIPLALARRTPRKGSGIFCGGRKDRDHAMALAGIPPGIKATFVSDQLPPATPRPGIEWRRERIPLTEYHAAMSAAAIVVVPVRPKAHPHGHLDVVRALCCGKPVVVTKGASCDDYIVQGRNGFLVEYSADGFRWGITQSFAQIDTLTKYCEEEAWKPHTQEAYLSRLLELINAR